MKRKIISFILIICMVVTVIPMTAGEANAAVSQSDGIKNRLTQVVNETNKKLKTPNVFSVNGSNCYVRGVNHTCSNCNLYQILNYFGESSLKSKASDGYQCAAFAKYVFVKTFGTTKDTIDSVNIGYGNKESTYKKFRTGDLFFTHNNHWMIFISCDSKGVNVLDCNGAGDLKIRFTKYEYGHSNLNGPVTVWQSPSATWNSINQKYGTSVSVAATSVTLNTTKKTMAAGTTCSLKATVLPSNASNKNVVWSSSNKSIAAVSSSGTVTAVKNGTAVITAKTANGKTAKCTVTVRSAKASDSTMKLKYTSGPSSTIVRGTSVYIKGTVSSNFKISQVNIIIKNAKGKTVQTGTYKPNAYTADVSKADLGKIYFSKLSAGSYTMYITAKDKAKSATLKKVPFKVSNTVLYNYAGPSSSIKKGTSVYVKGTIKSYHKIKTVSISIYNAKGKRVQVGSYSPNAYTADLSKADIGKIYFSKLSKGKYNMKVRVKTSAGTSVYKNVNFTVK